MLYKLGSTNGRFDTLEPVAFKDFSSFGNLEEDLEDLIANNILNVLFEEASLMPVFQERQWQPEADIYALNEKGELIIFELKRESAGEDAVTQALRYAQDAGQWSYATLQSKYRAYREKEDADLLAEHKDTFELEHKLDTKEINNKQRLVIIGSAADDSLINAVDYWKHQELSIDFLPYRVYELNGEKYFEFFALPYDKHSNPSHIKGVLFDTNRTYDEDSIWYMIENSRVAAFDDAMRWVNYVNQGDFVFFCHKGEGIVAAGQVQKGNIKSPDEHTLYRDVEFITPVPKKGEERYAMPYSNVYEITGKSFYHAKTLKVPYLAKEEAENLARELKSYLEEKYG